MSKYIIISITIIFVFTTNVSADGDFAHIGSDFKYLLSRPFKIRKSDLIPISITLGALSGLVLVDKPIFDYIQEEKTESVDEAFHIFKHLGDGRVTLSICTAVYLGGLIFRDKKTRKTAVLGVESFLISGLYVVILKSSFGRARPYADEGVLKLHPFTFKNKYLSLPSGHTQTAFSLASVISYQYPHWWVDALCYSAASLTGISRVVHRKHWPSDVALGALIAIAVSRSLTILNRGRDDEINTQSSRAFSFAQAAYFPGEGFRITYQLRY